MALVTANITVKGKPLKRAFVEHIAFGVSQRVNLTDSNGSFTFDAGFGFDRVDVRIHCFNSVARVFDGGTIFSSISIDKNVANGGTIRLNSAGEKQDHFDVLDQCLDVYDTVWRQFRPFNRSSRRDFPVGRRPTARETFASNHHIELNFPDNFPFATVAFVEPSGLNNDGLPTVHIKTDRGTDRILGTARQRDLVPHELGHAMHFSAMTAGTRLSIETQYLGFLGTHLSDPFHDVAKHTTPFVAFIEAVGIFSERFFFYRKNAGSNLTDLNARRGFFRDELDGQSLSGDMNDYVSVGKKHNGRVEPDLTGDDVEGAVYGAIYLDFASRVGLREAVGLVMDSNASTFTDFRNYVRGRGNEDWRRAINAARDTWGM